MPGRTIPEAVRNYLEPLQRSVSCLAGVGKIVTSSRVVKVGDFGTWILNGPEGMQLPNFGTLHAQQRYEVVETDPEHRLANSGENFRVSTREYLYKVQIAAGDHTMMWHWHPVGNSPERRPHIHPSFNQKAHMPSGRMAIEDVIEGCIALGAKESRDDWQKVLMESGGLHKLHRTWVDEPGDLQRNRP